MPAKRTGTVAQSSLRVGDYYIWDLYDATRQTTHWKTKDARILALADMETDHLINVAHHLIANRYRVLAFEEARYLLEGAANPWTGERVGTTVARMPGHDDVEHAWQQVLASDPAEWLQRTPLWAAIAAELARRGASIPTHPGDGGAAPERLHREAFAAIVAPVMASLSEKAAAARAGGNKA